MQLTEKIKLENLKLDILEVGLHFGSKNGCISINPQKFYTEVKPSPKWNVNSITDPLISVN